MNSCADQFQDNLSLCSRGVEQVMTSWGCSSKSAKKQFDFVFVSPVSVMIWRRRLSFFFFFSSSCRSRQSGNTSSDGACVMADGDLRPRTSRVTEKWVHSKVNHVSCLWLFCSSCFFYTDIVSCECWVLTFDLCSPAVPSWRATWASRSNSG